jgi:hypothetical protein
MPYACALSRKQASIHNPLLASYVALQPDDEVGSEDEADQEGQRTRNQGLAHSNGTQANDSPVASPLPYANGPVASPDPDSPAQENSAVTAAGHTGGIGRVGTEERHSISTSADYTARLLADRMLQGWALLGATCPRYGHSIRWMPCVWTQSGS